MEGVIKGDVTIPGFHIADRLNKHIIMEWTSPEKALEEAYEAANNVIPTDILLFAALNKTFPSLQRSL